MKIFAHFCFEKWPFAHFCLGFEEKKSEEKVGCGQKKWAFAHFCRMKVGRKIDEITSHKAT